MGTVAVRNSSQINPSKWKSSQPAKDRDLMFTADEVMNAWHDGKNHDSKIMRALFDANLKNAFSITEELVSELENSIIKVIETHLKPHSATQFKVLMLVDKEVFYSIKMAEVYSIKNKIEDSSQNELFSICYSFYPYSKDITHDKIQSDGYYFHYI